jgi:hypothetical protein
MTTRPTLFRVCAALLLAVGLGGAVELARAAAAEEPAGQDVTLTKPLLTQVTLTDGPGERFSGTLYKYNDTTLYFRTGKGEREIRWAQLTGISQFSIRSQLIDRQSANAWLELAELGMRWDLTDQARQAVTTAVRLDPKLKLRGDAILRGEGRARPTTQSKDPGKRGMATTTKYQKATPEQDAKAIEIAQKVAKAVADEMKLKWVELQTPHFIIFTDWDEREYKFLKDNCEAAYTAVSRQFDIPVKENVFIGKLPVFMFSKQSEFQKYAAQFDRFPAPKTVAGYYTSHGDGTGHMVMWKPDTSRYPTVREAEERWAYTLTHEFTHAFVSRYRTDRNIPRWLNEGLAEVIASGQFPLKEAHAYAKYMAGQKFKFEDLFDDKKMPGGEMYPVMQTMVEALIKESRREFLLMFDDIKDGMEPETALRKHYKAGYKDWEPAWRRYAKGL